MQIYRDLKRRIPRPLQPPPLQWEAEAWRWRCRLAIPDGQGGLLVERAAWLAVADRLGWDLDLAFHLLLLIETALSEALPHERTA